ncbi:5-formyltetrahydrofolate cyclo-ligase [Oricola nitratireducens]|uniref:5-formyltetrahydrofolate cyclo-ligase n=1 Tax=Oricola nitratireducens TaxID=2775868 RepID=UPI00186620B6|nr:5-formyltetrahydrofolate cyclo-ligase [Oricola nitratireducens]
MTDPDGPKDAIGGYASPPCLAHEIGPAYFEPLAVDQQQATNVARWRKAERARLLAQRSALPVAVRHEASEAVAEQLDRLLTARYGSIDGLTISAWWPIKAELNLRHWLEGVAARGARVTLPVVVTPAAPLVFRFWMPGCRMVQGFWKIPVPADGPEMVPDVTLAPVVGWDDAGFRLGYGGGYFDRTLAVLRPRPFVIGVGLQVARIPTIFPQPHDIAMDAIVTETGSQTGSGA